ncbi:unnamed protein product [Aphanomyces euteiches]|uniref:Uncharacterized protein n=1 Tax=Aphanomyces euteiches TaxID=100861 RepID=A0A6G0XFY4_9STRA|nr:hypothetical protein Ae201684_005124 [Aphanomyces euteiches]KAH9131645.1 hypothetical protein AeRB84_021695 [Aphanomyces euteiches]
MQDARRLAIQERIDAVLRSVAKEKKIWKRGYMRKYMQSHRDRDKREVEQLRQQVTALEHDLERLTGPRQDKSSSTILSWRDIALALNEAKDEETARLDESKRKSQALARLIVDLTQWLSSPTQLPASLPPHRLSWRNVSLPGSKESRHLGKEWITQQMFHNIERVFMEKSMPPPYSLEWMEELDVEVTDNSWHLDYRFHHVIKGNIEDEIAKHSKFHRHSMCQRLTVDAFNPITINTLVETTKHTTLHQMVTSHGEFVNLLCGEFIEPTRAVFVVQQIHHDEAVNLANPRQRDRIAWQEFLQLPSGVWVERRIYRMSQSFTKDGNLPLVDEARLWGVDLMHLSEEKQQSRFRQDALAIGKIAYNMS